MQISIIAPGSRGDVDPYIALGKGLKKVGHAVRLVTHLNFASRVMDCDLSFYPLHGDMEALMRDQVVGDALANNKPLAQLSLMRKKLVTLNGQWMRDCLEACQQVDVVIGGFGGLIAGQPVAEKLGIPFIQAWLVPFPPTCAFPAVSFPMLRNWLGGRLNRTSHVWGWRLLAWPMQRASVNLARREVLGLPPATYLDGPLAYFKKQSWPILLGFSEHVIPRPADWPAHLHITGYWFLDPPPVWQAPASLLDFLNSGPPPVYVGFGSMSHNDPQAATRLIVEALRISGQRGILVSGWGGLSQYNFPASVYYLDSVPHSWLFPQVSVVVHHGGAGTTAAGLRSGKPTICVPFISLDQGFWGWRVFDLGIGPKPIPISNLTSESLAKAIQTAVNDPAIRQRASELGEKIRGENGVSNAVAVIGQLKQSILK